MDLLLTKILINLHFQKRKFKLSKAKKAFKICFEKITSWKMIII